MVNVFTGPSQVTAEAVKYGVTVMVATTGDVPLFAAVNTEIFPVPLAGKPILVVLFAHE